MSNPFKFIVDGKVEDIKSKLTTILANEIKKAYVKTTWNNHELNVRIEKMGTSEIKIDLKQNGDQCTIQEGKRSLSMMHKPFIGEVEKIIEDLLVKKLGARRA